MLTFIVILTKMNTFTYTLPQIYGIPELKLTRFIREDILIKKLEQGEIGKNMVH